MDCFAALSNDGFEVLRLGLLKSKPGNTHRCRPGLEPGPITPNACCRATLARQSDSTAGAGGYGFLRSQGRQREQISEAKALPATIAKRLRKGATRRSNQLFHPVAP
jgi:hypothetical protein